MDEVQTWIDDDPDESCRAELTDLAARAESDEAALEELQDRFSGPLEFGTAGLRGQMAAGPHRMNRAVVMKAAKGLIEYLKTHVHNPVVVIGNDARHHSREFALDTAAIVTAAGGQALLLPDQVPTPVLAFAVRRLRADAGVMVTASHNPAVDNGYKVYLGGRMVPDPERGAQIIPPYDGDIAACIAEVGPARRIGRSGGWTSVDGQVLADYIAAVAEGPAPDADISIVHTAMHGVGNKPALAILARAGFTRVVSVAQQEVPDPDFPTVSFPNPEEPGAMDLALAKAAEVGADVVIANDPDADRCAVGVYDPRVGWRRLTGDELGALLGKEAALAASRASSARGDANTQTDSGAAGENPAGVLVNSIVSSRQLAQIAASCGVSYVRTLTGFKWMGRVPGLAFAYEEAIGYCPRPDLVHDKDGLACAVAVARLVARLKAEGLTLIDALDDLARAHGLYLTSQVAHRFDDTEGIAATMAKLRSAPPQTLAGAAVVTVSDLAEGIDGLPPTDGILLLTRENDRVIVRPSGTEPKVKCYLEVVIPVSEWASFDDLSAVRAEGNERLESIAADLRAELFS